MTERAVSSQRYAWYVLALLSLINLLNYVDRQIMFALYPFVQEDLGLSDFELGLLGAAFLLVHSICSIPGGILADRWFKRKVIALGVGLWSLATVLGGIARGFVDLFTFRALVGIGEAFYHPAANALLSDHFPPARRGSVMGVFSVGMVVGGGGGMIAGTLIGDYLGWRYAFLAAGVPGFFLATLAWRLREIHAVRARKAREERAALRAERRAGRRRLWRTPTVLFNICGGICVTFCIGGLIAWTVSFVDRYHVQAIESDPATAAAAGGLGALPPTSIHTLAPATEAAPTRRDRAPGALSSVSATFGVIALLGGILGSLVGGWLADRLMRQRSSGRLLVSAAGFFLGIPFCLVGLYTPSSALFLACLFAALFFFTWYMGPSIAILHDVVPYRYRATIAAWYIFAVHLLGDAISPPIIGWVSERSDLRTALLVPLCMAALGGVFFLLGTRTVAADMEVAAREGATHMAVDRPDARLSEAADG
jgi:MFS family permease